jgi:hypothetical protein
MKLAAAFAALALLATPAGAAEDGTPIAGAWRLIRRLPTPDHPVCLARVAGVEANMDLLLNNDGVPVLIAARPEWRSAGPIEIALTIDDKRAQKLTAQSAPPLVLVLLSDAKVVERLRQARSLTWSLPFGRVRTDMAGFDAALAAVKACQTEGVKTPG